MLRHLGASGLAITQVENASASGSTAVRQAALEVASGVSDLALALGIDKPLGKSLSLPRADSGIRKIPGRRVRGARTGGTKRFGLGTPFSETREAPR
jgi:acetyl-CoA acetyltransferase